jgi:SAM-dependent methyltransferase
MAEQPRASAGTPAIGDPYYRTDTGLRGKHLGVPPNASGREFARWALELVRPYPAMRVLDAGAGWGRFTWLLIETFGVPAGNVTACDASPGMVASLLDEGHGRRDLALQSCVAAIEALPFRERSFDLALANHVLYHVDLRRGPRELARILRPGGVLLATTNGDAIRVPVIELHYEALTRLGVLFEPEDPSPFSLENGAAALRTAFGQVETHVFEDEDVYPSLAAFVSSYSTIGRYQNTLLRDELDEPTKRQLLPAFASLAAGLTRPDGTVRTPVRMGAFVCGAPLAG